MKPTSLPSFTKLNQALAKAKVKLHPSQLHGIICGIICGGRDGQASLGGLVKGEENQTLQKELTTLYEINKKQLQDFLFELKLILPPETANLSARAEALTLWCQGFLTGLKISDVPIEHREAGELTEAIDDLIEITKMNYEDVVANEEDETAFTELVEYVRMAVILIYQEMHDAKGQVAAHLH